MIKNILFYIKEAFLSTKKNSITSLATIICLTATLIIVGLFIIISSNIDSFITNVESQLISVAYFKDNISEEEITGLVEEINNIEGVKEILYISKEEALQKLKEDLVEHEDILAGLPENPLPSSLEIQVYDIKHLEEVASLVSQLNGIDEVNYGGELTKSLMLIFNYIRKTGIGIILILLGVSTLIMFSVIKISVHTQQQEIEIMALVGATSWFIRWPFIIEGFLKGSLSSLIAFFLLNKAYQFFIGQVKEIIPFLPINIEREFIVRIGVMLFLMGALTGIFGSLISLRKISFEE